MRDGCSAINPYADLGLYAPAIMSMYGQFGDGAAPPPHVFGIAADAFKGEMSFGSLSTFFGGLEGLVGPPLIMDGSLRDKVINAATPI